MGTVHRLASHTKYIHQNSLRMKAFVAVVASLVASAKAQVLLNPYHGGLFAGAPVTYTGAPITTVAAAPAAAPVAYAGYPVAPLTQQFHSQDEFGNVAHGYNQLNAAAHTAGNALVGVSGAYSYVDPNGDLQTTTFVADGLGYRVKATNLPVAPTFDPELPVAPVDTAEVAAAKEAHAAAVAEVAAREKRPTPAATEPLVIPELKLAPYTYAGAYAPYGAYAHAPVFAGAYAHAPFAPLAYNAPLVAPAAPFKAVVAAAPGAAEATLTKIKLTPGHAIAYSLA